MHWLLLFSVIPQGLKLLERVICPNCCTIQREVLALPGHVWTDFSIADIPRADSDDPSCRQKEQPTVLEHSFQLLPNTYLLAELAAVLFCSLPLLFLLISDTGGVWMVHRVHKPASFYYFLNLFIRCVFRREKWWRIMRHPHTLQQLIATWGPAGFCSP